MYERFTDRSRKVMQLANQEAKHFQHDFIGTEHVLLGLVKEGTGVAADALRNLEIDFAIVRREIEKIIQSGPDRARRDKLPQTPRMKKVIEFAIEEARKLGHDYVGTEHLLLGLLREREGVAAQVLMNLGLRLAAVRAEVMNLLGRPEESVLDGPATVDDESTSETDLTIDRGEDAVQTSAKIEFALLLIERLTAEFNQMKETAVANQDFARAAGLRDWGDQLRKLKEWLERHQGDAPPETGIIRLS